MLIYIVVLVICSWAIFLKNKILKCYVLAFLAVFLCGGYMIGSDWRAYEISYDSSSFGTFLSERYEVGYGFFQALCNTIGIDFWLFYIALKLFVFGTFAYTVRWFGINVFAFLLLFMPEQGFFLFLDCPFRNFIAMGIFSVAIVAAIRCRLVVYTVLIVIASLFHSSAIFLYPFYWIVRMKVNNVVWIVLFALANIFAYKLELLISNIILPLLGISAFLADKFVNYLLSDNYMSNQINVGTLYRIFVFVLLIVHSKRIKFECQYGNALYNISMLYNIIYPFAISIKMFSRFSMYLTLFYVCTLLIMISLIRIKVYRNLFLSIVFVWSGIKSYSLLTSDYRYIPYSNYFEYMFEEEHSYSYRSNYNFQNSPYKNKGE